MIKFIKDLLKNKPNTTFPVPWQVDNYKEVMVKWNDYKNKDKKIIIEEEFKYILNMVFDFHLNDKNHVIIFYSINKDTALCMAKYRGGHINIEMPIDLIGDVGDSFVATYCPKDKNVFILK